MTSDEQKILTHLQFRTRKKERHHWIKVDEIKSAWAFDDFDKALESLRSQGLVEVSGQIVKITEDGKDVLK